MNGEKGFSFPGLTRDMRYHDNLIKRADELKYLLGKMLYEMSDISYQKGSRRGDFEIRDAVKALSEELTGYMGTLRMMDDARQGYIKAYGDIMVFFQNNFFEYCSVDRRLETVLSAIEDQQSLDRIHNETENNPAIKRKSNIFVDDLVKNTKTLKQKLHTLFRTNLVEFLNAVNELYFLESVKSLFEQTSSARQNREEKIRCFSGYCYTYLWENYRTGNRFKTRHEAVENIDTMLNRTGYAAEVTGNLGIGAGEYRKILSSAVDSVYNDLRSLDLKAFEDIHEDVSENLTLNTNRISRKDIRLLIDDIEKQTVRLSPYIRHGTEEQSGEKRKTRYAVYDAAESYEVHLKTVMFYLVDSLFFVYTWVLSELNNTSVAETALVSFSEIVPVCSRFMTLVRRAQNEVRTKKRFLSDNPVLMIPEELADEIRGMIRKTVQAVEQSFIESVVSLEFIRTKPAARLLKKAIIVKDSFTDSKLRIFEHLK